MADGINSRTLFSSTNSTQRGELLITFLDGNSAQNSSVGNPYGTQKITNFLLINMMILSVPLPTYKEQQCIQWIRKRGNRKRENERESKWVCWCAKEKVR